MTPDGRCLDTWPASFFANDCRRQAVARAAALGLFCMFGMALPAVVRAGPVTWTGSTSTAWSSGGNWVGGVAPANDTTTDIAAFDFASLPANQPNAGTRSVNGIVIGDGTTAVPAFTIAGATLTIGASGFVKNAVSLQTTMSKRSISTTAARSARRRT